MSENNPSDVKLHENPNGTVSFATEVVATIAGLAATEVDGVASMISPSSGLADMFSRKSNRNLTKGVRIDLADNMVSVDITITVEYGSPVPDVARNIQENVKKAIETMSGLDVKNVDVHVTGISFEREQRANAELDEQQRKMLEKNAESEAATEPGQAPLETEAPDAEEDLEEDDNLEEDDDLENDDDLEEDDFGEEKAFDDGEDRAESVADAGEPLTGEASEVEEPSEEEEEEEEKTAEPEI